MSLSVPDFYRSLADRAAAALADRDLDHKILIQVGSATCEHAAGSQAVAEEFARHLRASGRKDIVIHRTGCTGRCSREPIVGIQVPGQIPVKYERVNRDLVHRIFTEHIQSQAPVVKHILDHTGEALPEREFMFCEGSRCKGPGAGLRERFQALLEARGIAPQKVRVAAASCFGACGLSEGAPAAFVLVRPEKVLYQVATEEDLVALLEGHVMEGRVVERLKARQEPIALEFLERYGDVAFFNRQSRIALRNAGVVDPESLEEYLAYDGFKALAEVLARQDPDWVISELTKARLRGRGGGGFTTGAKWAMARKQADATRYIICNGDEGDPGAFMDRSMLESDPFNIVEGMIIGGHTIGARKGFFYIRAEYPLAIKRIQMAIDICRQNGLLGSGIAGSGIMGSGFDFDLEIRLGAGAFVCGEETALIRSIEGERGQPKVRPPYPTDRGLWGHPTVINNVETFANISAILRFSGDWYARIGTEKSGGTKVFALAGKVRHTGLVEVPLGTTLSRVVNEIGGGVSGGKALKAIQTGGPAGGFIPASMQDMEVDFEPLQKAGSIMGSGGMIVLSEDDCMVDIAKFYMAFSQEESCGKCTPCREGTTRILEILERITQGKGVPEDMDKLHRLSRLCQRTSLCGLGRAAPNPVLSSLKHFRDEFEAHIQDKRCPAKKCVALIRYEINAEKCIGCTICARNCPAECISGARKEAHVIDQDACIKCGNCFDVCKFTAIDRV